MKNLTKQMVTTELVDCINTKNLGNNKRRYEARQLSNFLRIVQQTEFNQLSGIRTTANGFLNLGDLAEMIAKKLIGNKQLYLSRATAKSLDGFKNRQAYEIKSHLINPSSPLSSTNKAVYFITEKALYFIPAEVVQENLSVGERMTKSLVDIIGGELLLTW